MLKLFLYLQLKSLYKIIRKSLLNKEIVLRIHPQKKYSKWDEKCLSVAADWRSFV